MLSALCAQSLCAQQNENDQYKIGLAFEQNGKVEDAARIYYELYKSDPTSEMYFNDVQRSFMELKRYGALDTLIMLRMRIRPNSFSLYALLGAVKYHEGNEPAAQAAWDSALSYAGTSSPIYRQVATTMIQAQAFKEAAACYQRARAVLHDENAFDNDLSYIYTMLLDYHNATLEYIRQIRRHEMPLSIVESRMGEFTTYAEGITQALDAARHAADEDADNAGNIEIHYLYAWLLMENKSYTGAFEEYKKIDKMRNANGRDMMSFAGQALEDGAFDESLKAYHAVDEASTDDMVRAWAEFGAAHVDEELWLRENPDSIALATVVAAEYDAVAKRHPRTLWADSAALRSATILFDPVFDCPGAEQRVKSLLAIPNQISRSGAANILLGKIYTAENKLDSAALEYGLVLNMTTSAGSQNPQGVIPFRMNGGGMQITRVPNEGGGDEGVSDVRQEARYLLAELLYFGGNFDSAKVLLEECTAHVNAEYANDAIELTEIINENTAHNDAQSRDMLKQFAQAELCKRRHDFEQAIALLQNISFAGASLPIAERALIVEGDDFTHMRQFTQSLGAYRKLLDAFPESILRDRAQMRIAVLYDTRLRNPAEAIQAYEKLLADYPGSIYVDEARKRIVALRGGS